MFVSKHALIKACFRVVDLFPAEVNLVASLLRQIRVLKLPHRDMRACSEFCDSEAVFKSVLRACSASSECAHANTMHVSWGGSFLGEK